jgi:photosystem II stability/assembly factor-like uncharacterized protein
MSSLFSKRLVLLLVMPLLLMSPLSAARFQDEPAESPDRRGLPYPYCFGQFCRLERDEWIVGGRGQVIHFSTDAPMREQSLTKEDLSGVYFVNASTGWVVGTNGTIFHTMDGGNQWIPQVSQVKKDLRAITCADESHCWAVGYSGVILRTEDGGRQWTQVKINVSEIFYAVDFISEQIGWAVGEDGIVFHTRNGGRTWDEHRATILFSPGTDFEEPADMLAVKFANEKLGWVAGRNGIARTTDGGLTWEVKVEDETFIGLISCDGNKVWAINKGGPNYCSDDGGQTWHKCQETKS